VGGQLETLWRVSPALSVASLPSRWRSRLAGNGARNTHATSPTLLACEILNRNLRHERAPCDESGAPWSGLTWDFPLHI